MGTYVGQLSAIAFVSTPCKSLSSSQLVEDRARIRITVTNLFLIPHVYRIGYPTLIAQIFKARPSPYGMLSKMLAVLF